MSQSITIIIPSFNGKELLEKHLPHIIKNSPEADKIIIVDDGSTDGTCGWLADNYPRVTCLHHARNIGFTLSVNIAAESSDSDFIVLLNNDVEPLQGYLHQTLKFFKDKDVFAVSFSEKNSSWPQVSWNGKLAYVRGKDKSIARYSAWASGGSAIFRKSIWDSLRGFDGIFAPAYWEDIDIGYRAWKQGYKIVWAPEAKVIHEHESSYSKLNKNYINGIKQRNELLFNWLNITDRDLVSQHKHWLLIYSLTHPGYIKVVLSALSRYLLSARKRHFKLSDSQILSQMNLPL